VLCSVFDALGIVGGQDGINGGWLDASSTRRGELGQYWGDPGGLMVIASVRCGEAGLYWGDVGLYPGELGGLNAVASRCGEVGL
jgi:hypothetical protein